MPPYHMSAQLNALPVCCVQAVLWDWFVVLKHGLHELQLVVRDLQYVAAAAADAESNPEARVRLKVNLPAQAT